VKIIGKPIPIDIMEILDVDPESVKSLKIQSKPLFELAISSFEKEDYKNAKEYFQQIYSKNNKDNVAAYFIRKCESFEKAGKS
jgi:hypothetical protein